MAMEFFSSTTDHWVILLFMPFIDSVLKITIGLLDLELDGSVKIVLHWNPGADRSALRYILNPKNIPGVVFPIFEAESKHE